MDVEHVGHPQVLRPCDALHGADDRRRFGSAQQVAKREAAGQRVRIRIVVQEDQHAIGVGKVTLILLHARARHRAAQLRHQRRANQLGDVHVRDVSHRLPRRLGHARVSRTGVQHVDQRASRVAHRRHDLVDAAASVVLDDETGAGGDVRFQVGIDAARVGGAYADAGVVEAPGQGAAFHKEIHLEAREQHVVQRANDQLVLTDGEDAHVSRASGSGSHVRSAKRSWATTDYTPPRVKRRR